jgi:hypothetical protein
MTNVNIFPNPSYRTGKQNMIASGIDNHVLVSFYNAKEYLYNREKQRLKEKLYA